jgi:para-nitrobenzyl esterase
MTLLSRIVPQTIGTSIVVTALACLSVACNEESPDNRADDSAGTQGSSTGSALQVGDGGSASSADAAATTEPCPAPPTSDALVVATDKGLVKGTQNGIVSAFQGIPFAKPPIGKLRFMPPVPADGWSGVKDASKRGDICAQISMEGKLMGSEDCLTLNVWTPALPTATSCKKLPVLFWLYGGADMWGGAADGQSIANAENAILVSFNYRVGPLGFLAHPALTAASPHHTSGNNGLLDAQLALQWVQDNIAAFGGDKTHVMIFGQSAGAINTCALVASPLSKGLFSSALMESGNCAAETLAYRYPRGEAVAVGAGCALSHDVVSCLQNAPVSSILDTGGATFVASFASQIVTTSIDPAHVEDLPFAPTIDDYVLDAKPEATIKAGKHNHVPLVIGTNSEELKFGAPASPFPAVPIASCLEYAALVTAVFPGIAVPLLQKYPCNVLDPKSGYEEIGDVATDAFFTCPSRRALRAAAATQTEPVYHYLFSRGNAVHSVEVGYVFGAVTSSPDDVALSHQMMSYWVNFAATGNPNGAGLPTWNQYDPAADSAIKLDVPIGTVSGFEASGCNFWDTVQ